MQRQQDTDPNGQSARLPWRRTAFWLICAAASWGLMRVAQIRPEWVERYYSQGLYPHLRGGLSRLSRSFPFSLAGGLLFAILFAGCVWCGVGWRKFRRGQVGGLTLLLAGGLRVLRLGSIGILAFGFLWGIQHARLPLSRGANLPPVEDKGPALEALAQRLVEDLIRDRAIGLPPEGFAVLDGRGRPDGRIARALSRAARGVPSLAGEAPVLRSVPFWPLFAKLGIAGIFIPFTGEAHFNGGVPACRRPFIALHEVAHQRGFAREDEANFLGWLICASSEDAHYRYSGNLAAFSLVLGPLYGQNADLARRLLDRLPESVREDMRAVREFWKSYESPARTVSIKVNDLYLKSHGQSHGVQSYGRMVELMLSYQARSW